MKTQKKRKFIYTMRNHNLWFEKIISNFDGCQHDLSSSSSPFCFLFHGFFSVYIVIYDWLSNWMYYFILFKFIQIYCEKNGIIQPFRPLFIQLYVKYKIWVFDLVIQRSSKKREKRLAHLKTKHIFRSFEWNLNFAHFEKYSSGRILL